MTKKDASAPEKPATSRPPRKGQGNKTARYGKHDQRYWQQRLFKRVVRRGGSLEETSQWYARIQHSGKEIRFNLDLANRETAARRARDIYLYLRGNGWEKTLAKFKPAAPEEKRPDPTIGEFFKAVRESEVLEPKTLEMYFRKFRTIAGGVFGINGPKEGGSRKKYDVRNGGLHEWRERIESKRLSALTPEKVQRWARRYVERSNTSPVDQKRAQHSVNSLLRNARALFGQRVLKGLSGFQMHRPLPFEGVELYHTGSMRYRSSIDPISLLKKAKADLMERHPEQFKAFVLCLLLGLRRKEADLLMWKSVLWDQQVIRVERNDFFNPKREYSLGDIPMEPELLTLLRHFYEKRNGPFILESSVTPKLANTYEYYRAKKHFTGLIKWLRAQGVDSTTPLHTLRKEFGRLINEKYGIYAASRLLRHGGIGITAAHYADDTRRLVPGLGHVLKQSETEKKGGNTG